MYYEIELRIPALTSCMHVVDVCVQRLSRTVFGNEDSDFLNAVQLACLHTINQAYGGDEVDQRIELLFAVGPKELQVTLSDFGKAINILEEGDLAAVAQRLDGASYTRRDESNIVWLARRA